MRHNKLAGTRFLLGSRKHKPSTFTSSSTSKNTSDNTSNSNIATDCNCGNTNTGATNNNMLHSKSTYFYRWFSEHLGLVVSGLSTKNINKVSKTSKTSYLVPAVCGAALLGTLGFIVNPAAGKIEAVYAAEGSSDKCMNGEASSTGQCPMELSLTMSGANGTGAYEEAGATQLEVGKTAYRSYDFKVSATDIDKDGYKLYATAVETKLGEIDLTNQLVNADYPNEARIEPISTTEGVLGESITAGQWGYAIAGGGVDSILPTVDTANTNPGSLTYKAVPTNQTIPIATGTETTTIDSGIPDNPATVPDEYRLIFGAKANESMASGHYRTQVMLSLVADPKNVAKTMQKFAEDLACKDLEANSSIQLIDDRTASGLGQTKYWVTKLKDGKCWMTQNLDLALKVGDVLKPDDTDIAANYTVSALGSYRDPGMINYKVSAANGNFGSACGDPAGSGCSAYFETYTGSIDGDTTAHYLIGNYYPYAVATAGKTAENAGSICPKGWKLPTNSEYSTITSLGNSPTGSNAVRKDPYYFPAAGYHHSNWDSVASCGRYWSSTPNGSNAYGLNFINGSLSMVGDNGQFASFPIRCVMR